MKLQFNTVEYNIKKLNEQLKYYNEAYNIKDLLLSEIIMGQINRITYELTESIKRGQWYSYNLILLNGVPYKNPSSFYVEFSKSY